MALPRYAFYPKSARQCLRKLMEVSTLHRPELTLPSLKKKREGYQRYTYHNGFQQ